MAADIVRTWGQPLEKENIASQLIAIKKWGKMIIGIVGISEYDNPVFQSCEQKGCDPDRSGKYTRFQKKVYQAVKSDRDLDIPVVLGSIVHLINDAIIKSAKTYRLYNATASAKLSPIKSWTNVSKLSLAVADDILVVEFTTSTTEP